MPVTVTDIQKTGGILMPYARAGSETAAKTLVVIPGLSVKPVAPIIGAVAGQYAAFLKAGYRLFLFDRRQNMPEGQTAEDMAEDTAAVMASLGIRKADVFGASQGGMIAAALAMAHPELVDHLVLGSTSLRHGPYSDAQFAHWMELARQKDDRGLFAACGKAMYSPASWAAHGEAFIDANAGVTEAEFALFLRTASALFSVDMLARARQIKARTLVIGCRGDKVFTAGPSEEIVKALGCESYFYGEEYGHAVYDEAPDYAQRVFDFCTR